MQPDRLDIFKEFTFEAAHRLTGLPSSHKCSRLHGHSFRAELHLSGETTNGMVMDFAAVKRVWEEHCGDLDHNYLNQIDGLSQPTAENIARLIWMRLKPQLPLLTEVVVRETCTAGAIYPPRWRSPR